MSTPKPKSIFEVGLSAILMFIVGFVGFSILGAIALVILIALGVLPVI
jgi:hypothetical protein